MPEAGARIHPADSVSGGLIPTLTAGDCGCSLGHSEGRAAESPWICEFMEEQQLQAGLGEALWTTNFHFQNPGASLCHCSAPALLPAYEVLCAAAFHSAQEDSAITGPSKRMNGKERKYKKRISRENIHPGRVKPLSTLPNDWPNQGS